VKATFQGFRLRLTLHAKEGLAFERSVQTARAAGLLPKQLEIALDSTPVRGRGAVKDTFNLLSDAIRNVIRAIAAEREQTPEKVAAQVGVERHFRAPSIKGDEVVDWNDKESVNGFLERLLKDCDETVKAARKAKCATDEVALLEKVIDQDVDRTGGDGPTIKKEVAKDRTVSISDPEMRHGRKSSGKTFNGHKGHVAVETTSGIVTAVGDVTAPSEPDGGKVAELIEETERTTGLPVKRALGDAAYSSRTACAQAAGEEVELKTKMPSPPAGRFGPEDFKVSADLSSVKCPAGHPSQSHFEGDKGTIHYWPAKLCSACPLKAQCTKAEFRQFLVPPDFHDRRRREREARSPKGRVVLKRRVTVEHAIGRMKNLGAGEARYFGRVKTRGQLFWCATVANLIRVWKKTGEGETRKSSRRVA
jgi:hypothetical protein